MTTGSSSKPGVAQLAYQYVYDTNTTTSFGSLWSGVKESRSWTGTDRPRLPKVYEVFKFRISGVWYRTKHRVDVPSRKKEDDHPYHLNYSRQVSSHYSKIEYQTKYLSYPPFTPYRTLWRKTYYPSWSIGPPVTTSYWTTADDTTTIMRLREVISGSEFNFGVFLGEGHQALNMITDAANRIYRSLKAVRKGNLWSAAVVLGLDPKYIDAKTFSIRKTPFTRKINVSGSREFSTVSFVRPIKPKTLPGAVKTVDSRFYVDRKIVHHDRQAQKAIASRWLELQYGWLPLLEDTKQAAEMVAQICNYPFVKSYKARHKREKKMTPPSSYTQAIICDGLVRSQIIARMEEVSVAKLSGLTDPATVMWELVPYSFVVDWFIPIGNYLAARGVASALTGTFVTSKTDKERWRFSTQSAPAGDDTKYSDVFYSGIRITADRTVSTTLSVPFPKVRPLSKALSWKHCANAVALLTGGISPHK